MKPFNKYIPQEQFAGWTECLTYDALGDILTLLEGKKEEVIEYDVEVV